MNKQKEKVPDLRFKGFTDDWEQRKFSEILAKSDGLRRGPFGSALKKEFFISSSEYTVYEQNNAIYNTWKTRYFITPEKFQELHKFQLMPGDFILSGAGTIGRIAQVPANITKGVFNQALIRIRINPEWMDKKFFLIWMQSENMQRKLTQANPGSAMTNLVPMSEIKKWEIIIPSKAEQNKIGEFIQKLNSFITLHQRKLDLLNQLKKGLLQKMFADKGSKRPILRFNGFTDDWEQRKLEEVKDVRDGTHSSPNYQEEGYPLVTSKNLSANGIDLSDVSFINKYDYQEINKRSKVENGDILFGMIGTIGNPVMVKKGGFAIKNVALIKHGGELSNGFLLYLLKSPIFLQYINRENAGGTQKFLGLSIIRNFKFKVPNKVEQRNIAIILNSLTCLIALQHQKLKKVNKIKESLLQQMFI